MAMGSFLSSSSAGSVVRWSAWVACAGLLFAGCGGATFRGDGDDAGGEGGSGGSNAGKGGNSGSGGSAGKSSGGSSGSGATSGAGGRAGGGGASGSGAAGSAGSGNTGNAGGTSGMGAAGGSGGSGGSGNTGNAAGTSGSAGAGESGAASTEQWAAEYDQGCEFDENCSLVQQGDKCACPTCDSGAVNHGVFDKYQADWRAIVCPMGAPDCPAIACEQELPACTEKGECYARTPTYIDAANYPQACEQPSDCHAIFTGEVCSSCQCATAAVNDDGYEQYRADVEAVDCTPGPSVCDCAPQLGVTCLVDLMGSGSCVMASAVGED